VLIDTSAWAEALRRRGDEATREAVRVSLTEGRAVTCPLVLLELWNGARGADEARMLRDIEAELDVVDIDHAVWSAATSLARACRAAGTTVPATDLLVAACAARHSLDLLHHDKHFDTIARVAARR
jgi:hypothetical protein